MLIVPLFLESPVLPPPSPLLYPVHLIGNFFLVIVSIMTDIQVRRYMDIRNPGSVNRDPIFSSNSLPDGDVGYPGGIFNPLGFGGDNPAGLRDKELINARSAMVSFVGFVVQYQV